MLTSGSTIPDYLAFVFGTANGSAKATAMEFSDEVCWPASDINRALRNLQYQCTEDDVTDTVSISVYDDDGIAESDGDDLDDGNCCSDRTAAVRVLDPVLGGGEGVRNRRRLLRRNVSIGNVLFYHFIRIASRMLAGALVSLKVTATMTGLIVWTARSGSSYAASSSPVFAVVVLACDLLLQGEETAKRSKNTEEGGQFRSKSDQGAKCCLVRLICCGGKAANKDSEKEENKEEEKRKKNAATLAAAAAYASVYALSCALCAGFSALAKANEAAVGMSTIL